MKMADDNQLRALNCPNCGAPLDFPPGQSTVKCAFCQTVVERPEEPAAPAETAPPNIIITTHTITPTRTIRPRPGGYFVAGLVAALVVLGLIPVGIALLAERQSAGLISGLVETASVSLPRPPPNLYIVGEGRLIPPTTDAPPDVAVLTINRDDNSHALAVLDGARPEMRWRGAPLDQDDFSVPILANRDFVYTVSKARLLAMHRADGATAWEAALADALSVSCDNCLRLLGNQLIALTADGTVQAVDAQTGNRLWTVRAQDIPGELLVTDGQPAFQSEAEGGEALIVMDPATGAVARTIQPRCEVEDISIPQTLDFTSAAVTRDDSPALYVAFGHFSTCVQKWDTTTGQMLWQTEFEGNFSPGVQSLATEADLYLAGNGKALALNVDTGELRALADEEDYTLVPLAAQGNVLIVRAKRMRGTTRFEIWGLDAATGEHLWEHSLGEGGPLDPPDEYPGLVSEGDSVWTWRMTPAGFMVLQIHSAPHQLILETLNVQTGASSGQSILALDFDTPFLGPPGVIGWTRDTVWLVIENGVIGTDTAAGEIVYRWP